MKYLVHQNGQYVGPFTVEQLQRMVIAGSMGRMDSAYPEQGGNLILLRDLLGPLPTTPPPDRSHMSAAASSATSTERREHQGLGIWLILFCVMFGLLIPAFRIWQTSHTFGRQLDAIARKIPEIKTAAYVEVGAFDFLAVCGAVVALLVALGSGSGKTMSVQYLGCHLIVAGLAVATVLGILSTIQGINMSKAIPSMAGVVMREFIITVPWLLYFCNSSRVREMYGD